MTIESEDLLSSPRLKMQGSSLLTALLWLAHSGLAWPLSTSTNEIQSNGIRLPLRRSANPLRSHRRRQLSVDLENNETGYLVDLEVGTPGQSVTLSIDTGSSDIWVFAPEGCDNCNGGTCKSSPSMRSSSTNHDEMIPRHRVQSSPLTTSELSR